jgi:acyl-CoA hydrolase/GNAT superfamily N-acetyltransferase
MRIHLSGGAACPLQLIEGLLAEAVAIGDLELIHGMVLPPMPWLAAAKAGHLKLNAFYLDPQVAELVNSGTADYTPVHYSDVPAMYTDGTIRVDAAMVMVTPPDAHGYCSLGPSVEWSHAALDHARVKIAQFNPRMPRTNGQSHVHVSTFDYALQADAALPNLPPVVVDPEHRRIAEYVAQLIRDGDTLQFGVGPVANALGDALHDHRHLGIHCEVISDVVMRLFAAGVIDNSRKSLLPGHVVTSLAVGSAELYAFLDNNPHFDFRPTDFTNNPATIARNQHMVAVNSALLCDLTGQVVLDAVRGQFRSGIASTVDFVRGCAIANDGRAILTLPSTGIDQDGKRFSRIVANLPGGAGVGCNRSDVTYLVTEFGIATLRGRTIQERVQEMIQVAHPDFREDLLREARGYHLLPEYFQLPPLAKANDNGIAVRRLHLRDGLDYLLRPLNPADDRRLQEFFYSHTEETIVRRYGFTITRMSRERAFELVGVDQSRDLALAIVELQGPRQVIRAIGRYYLDADGSGAEMAFVVGENKRRLGMARVLLERMLEIAAQRGLQRLWAQVDRDNTPMLALFRDYHATESGGDDPHTLGIEILIPSDKLPVSKKRPDFLQFIRRRH